MRSFDKLRTGSLPSALPLLALGSVLALAACGKGTSINAPLPTPSPVVPKVSAEFAVPTANSQPEGIARGSDGYLYFTEEAGDKIGKMTTAGSFTETALPTGAAAPLGIINGQNGALWFCENAASKIGEMTTAGTVTEFPTATAGSGPTFITTGPDGALWFVEAAANKIGRITTGGAATDYPIPTANAGLSGIVTGPDGALWFTEAAADKIGRIDPNTYQVTEYPVPTPNAGPTQIVVGPDPNVGLWFIESNAAKLGEITTAGQVTEYPLSPAASARGLILGGDGNFYFTDPTQNAVGQVLVNSGFAVKEFPVPTTAAGPAYLAIGPDFRIYLTEASTNKIAQFSYF